MAEDLDFSGQNLRGWSFKSRNLTGANFSYADIRGADFTSAILRDANFSCAKAGLQRRWIILLNVVSFFLASISGAAARFAGGIATNGIATASNQAVSAASIVTMIVLAVLAILFIFIALRGVTADLAALLGAIVGALIVFGAVAGYSFGDMGLRLVMRAAWALSGTLPWALAGALVVALAGTLLWTLAITSAQFLAGALALVGLWVWPWAKVAVFFKPVTSVVVVAVVVAVALAVVLFGSYLGWRAWVGDEKFALIRQIAIAFAAIGGTSFRGANLTNANFMQATLKSTDLRKAIVTRTCWSKVKMLDRARVGGTILINSDVRDLLVTGQGRKRYIGRNLKGANLAGADLKDADLTEADISGATLEGACLERANLTKIQALGANFNQAILTGACLEAWNIDSTTQLDGAICEYVYLLNNQQERRPSSGEFAPGEFTKLFQEVLNTVDLIFRDGIDWKAFTYSLNKLILDNEGTQLEIQSIENKGDGVVVVRVNVPPDANKAKIHSEFNQNYEAKLKALEARHQVELKAKDDQIIAIYREKSADMKEIASWLANRPVTVDVKATAESKAMNESADESRKIEISGNVTGSTLNLGEISGTVTTTINQLPDSSQANQAGIKELLTQLQTAIEAENDLPQEDKAEALEQVKVLAEAGKNPQEGTMQKMGKTAIKILKGTAAGLPSAAKLVEECNKLLPLISKLLGLG